MQLSLGDLSQPGVGTASPMAQGYTMGDAPLGCLGHLASCFLFHLQVGRRFWGHPGGLVRVRAGLPPGRRAGDCFLVGIVRTKLEVG